MVYPKGPKGKIAQTSLGVVRTSTWHLPDSIFSAYTLRLPFFTELTLSSGELKKGWPKVEEVGLDGAQHLKRMAEASKCDGSAMWGSRGAPWSWRSTLASLEAFPLDIFFICFIICFIFWFAKTIQVIHFCGRKTPGGSCRDDMQHSHARLLRFACTCWTPALYEQSRWNSRQTFKW